MSQCLEIVSNFIVQGLVPVYFLLGGYFDVFHKHFSWLRLAYFIMFME